VSHSLAPTQAFNSFILPYVSARALFYNTLNVARRSITAPLCILYDRDFEPKHVIFAYTRIKIN